MRAGRHDDGQTQEEATEDHRPLRRSTPEGHGPKPIAIVWGAEDPMVRGPLVGTVTSTAQRNVIGTHAGSYSVYRAVAVAAGALDPLKKPDLTNTAPTHAIGPFPQWFDPSKIVSMDPFGAVVSAAFKSYSRGGATTSGPTVVVDARAHSRPRARRCRHGGPREGRRQDPPRGRRHRRRQGGDRARMVAARGRGALRLHRGRSPAHALRAHGGHVPRARDARRSQRLSAAHRRRDRLHDRRRDEHPGPE